MLEGGAADEAAAKLKKVVFITDAMTADELDSDGSSFVRLLPTLPMRLTSEG